VKVAAGLTGVLSVGLVVLATTGGAVPARPTLGTPVPVAVTPTIAVPQTVPPIPAPPPTNPPSTAAVTIAPQVVKAPRPTIPPLIVHRPGLLTARCSDGTISVAPQDQLCYHHGGIRYTL
jgi:hypothetical protein